ncbi:hypothetical protein TraAM80_03737 [Trypanosoma rangeli]|uniref:Methyltransferase domain-containing protein n=1 Tax=Trypanosoma rangeli TaxID=5698 RepID=A0A422NN81_TRYRA|nr:uncharacterized protein TraAM80_03737 [Trypanosoma rangeli]RNF06921.1 hypothetical protein TraAM80_03737 [Trypanosoma rangeli]|eukprot:RNF06921.1 hypothetical protein TraAM80_03737 [Trypanosoma rangeli]
MEPDDVAEYSRQSYWERRYSKEAHYNWFPSVHQSVVLALCDELAKTFGLREAQGAAVPAEAHAGSPVLRVLHLGTGNSSLCMDLYEAVRARQLPFTLEQVAMDYAPNVIANMQAKYPPGVLPNTTWRVGDVRRLEEFRLLGPFDAIIDKGTMDALESDKDSPTMEDDIGAMLRGVDGLLQHAKGYGTFMQVTWVVPYMRLHYTRRDAFAWGDQVRYTLLGDSDMYRLFVYTTKP